MQLKKWFLFSSLICLLCWVMFILPNLHNLQAMILLLLLSQASVLAWERRTTEPWFAECCRWSYSMKLFKYTRALISTHNNQKAWNHHRVFPSASFSFMKQNAEFCKSTTTCDKCLWVVDLFKKFSKRIFSKMEKDKSMVIIVH